VRVLGRRLALTVAISLFVSTEFYFQPLHTRTAGLEFDLWQWPLHAAKCLWMGMAMMLALSLAELAARGWPAGWAFALYAFALASGAIVGTAALNPLPAVGWGANQGRRFWAEVCFWMAIGHANATIHVLQQRASRAADELHRADARRIALGKENLTARLNVLRAQIEPHFLFNALANVRRLCHDDVDAGVAMLRSLGCYLRAVWPRMHEPTATLAHEVDLVSAYFDILKVRMGRRLRHVIDIPAELSGHPFPSMMLLTLAENAIKHGLAPTTHGGTVVIRARATPGWLEVTVSDDGVGFAAVPAGGSGVGLANSRARLRALFGNAGSLALAPNAPSGVIATLRLPLQGHDTAHGTEARR
jgi:hypothetical protein